MQGTNAVCLVAMYIVLRSRGPWRTLVYLQYKQCGVDSRDGGLEVRIQTRSLSLAGAQLSHPLPRGTVHVPSLGNLAQYCPTRMRSLTYSRTRQVRKE